MTVVTNPIITGVINNLSASGLTLPSTEAAVAQSGTDINIGATTQATIGANGGASALTALPLGYLIGFKGATKIVIPYYNG